MSLDKLTTKQIERILDKHNGGRGYVARMKNGFTFIEDVSGYNFVHNVKDLENILQLRLQVSIMQNALRELKSGVKPDKDKYINIAKEQTKDWPQWKRDMFKPEDK